MTILHSFTDPQAKQLAEAKTQLAVFHARVEAEGMCTAWHVDAVRVSTNEAARHTMDAS